MAAMWNWFDVALVILLVWSAALGLRAGLARVVIGLAATLTGLLLGFWLYRLPASKFVEWVGQPQLADFLGFLAIFIGVVLIGWLLAALLSRLFDWVGLSWFNHLMGGVAGFIRGAVLIAALNADRELLAVDFGEGPKGPAVRMSRVVMPGKHAGELDLRCNKNDVVLYNETELYRAGINSDSVKRIRFDWPRPSTVAHREIHVTGMALTDRGEVFISTMTHVNESWSTAL